MCTGKVAYGSQGELTWGYKCDIVLFLSLQAVPKTSHFCKDVLSICSPRCGAAGSLLYLASVERVRVTPMYLS